MEKLRELTCMMPQINAARFTILRFSNLKSLRRVEYFGEKINGICFTQNGWVQSYGSRCTRPPIIYDDIVRPAAMTVEEFEWAQSLTPTPVKGMLTGPVTILNWSFPRKDISRSSQAFQIALAIREEVKDLEVAGCKVIQVDEPAIREGLPLKKENWDGYLEWAVDAFRYSWHFKLFQIPTMLSL